MKDLHWGWYVAAAAGVAVVGFVAWRRYDAKRKVLQQNPAPDAGRPRSPLDNVVPFQAARPAS